MPCENAESEDAIAYCTGETSRCGSPVLRSSVPGLRFPGSSSPPVTARRARSLERDGGFGEDAIESGALDGRLAVAGFEPGDERRGKSSNDLRLSLVREIGLVLIRGMVTSAES